MSKSGFSLAGTRFLITQSSLRHIAGSEMVTLELAEYLQNQGTKVTVFAWTSEPPMSTELSQRRIIVVTNEDSLSLSDFDYIWVHHQVLPLSIIRQLSSSSTAKSAFIFHHMSAHPNIHLEHPYIHQLEKTLATISTFVSPECQKFNKSHYGHFFNHSQIFPNFIPSQYMHRNATTPQLRHILIASSHAPTEVSEAATLLHDQGYTVDVLGKDTSNYQIVTPALLKNYDCVITIGKTLQYCLGLNIPVFLYDIHGGCGYLNQYNYQKAFFTNFSGRGFQRKTPSKIAIEIVNGFNHAYQYQSIHYSANTAQFELSKIFPNLIAKITPRSVHIDEYFQNYLIAAESIAKEKVLADNLLYSKLRYEIPKLETTIATLQQTINDQEQTIADQKALITAMKNSRAVKLARLVRTPFKHTKSPNNPLSSLPRFSDHQVTYLQKPKRNHHTIVGLIREKNESLILDDTLSQLEQIVDGFILYDDNSGDDSIQIAKSHPKCLCVIQNHKTITGDRSMEESISREYLLQIGRAYHPVWFFYQDADERIENPTGLRQFLLEQVNNTSISGIRLSLFDAYITKDDQAPYQSGNLFNFRKMFGPERRDILMTWKDAPEITFMTHPDLREPDKVDPGGIITRFYVQHYGKAISIDQWEETCNYYCDHFPQYAQKWQSRKGKAIHVKSDFNRNLLTWQKAKETDGIKIN